MSPLLQIRVVSTEIGQAATTPAGSVFAQGMLVGNDGVAQIAYVHFVAILSRHAMRGSLREQQQQSIRLRPARRR